jgi:FMN phosphatase YigB (HAD superfamily)
MIEKDRQILLTDHDGTLTDSDKEASEYGQMVREYINKTLSIPVDEIDKRLQVELKEIEKKSDVLGWKIGEIVVAPAMADHYILYTVAVSMMLAKLASESYALRRFTSEEIEKYVGEVFRVCSPKLGVFYREGAKEFMASLRGAGEFGIITNSDPAVVKNKLRVLLGDGVEGLKIVGGAKKYSVNLTAMEGVVPEGAYKGFPGFPERGVYLQREKYYMTLLDIANGDISRVKMVGDIAELDLLMIDYLGGRTALVLSQTTAEWEKKYYQSGENRFASHNLGEVADWMINK